MDPKESQKAAVEPQAEGWSSLRPFIWVSAGGRKRIESAKGKFSEELRIHRGDFGDAKTQEKLEIAADNCIQQACRGR